MKEQMNSDIAVIGLAVMGANLALNLERHGCRVALFNRDHAKTDALVNGPGKGKNFVPASTVAELCQSLKTPRKILMMIRAGEPVDRLIALLLPNLERGDILIDGGNSYFEDTERRETYLKLRGIRYLGVGISGGEEGALNGPAIMPGGDESAWEEVAPILNSIAAEANGVPCCRWTGPGGAGHFVKMVHNGIEYGDMQLISEAYGYLRDRLHLDNPAISEVFRKWNTGRLNSYLIEITAEILLKTDPETGRSLVDLIVDSAEQKGTGKWAASQAIELGVPGMTLADAVFARILSSQRSMRQTGANLFHSPPYRAPQIDDVLEKLGDALFAAKLCSYAQGFQLLRTASDAHQWTLKLADIAQCWQGGCIIRAGFLREISRAFLENKDLGNLIFYDYFKNALNACSRAWREIAADALTAGLPMPAFTSALAYFDSCRTVRLPANLIQAQRDFFGAHSYERLDKTPGTYYHTIWTNVSQ